ncbi:sl [Drosophila busckii]|uniref:1-phosphatidylinositol 4,5-bisphosphate phosphodiesterase gamma n=1 Tax=Drosophila busckii TaxID=30019 RepID=A0A0M4EXP6_DROBS|nr:1-phosphatidylinositol 4,5-bisphosphate phosphodiesterase gamma-1 [Drosophila busckii]ALC48580.1 sl [Drosophila busckii]
MSCFSAMNTPLLGEMEQTICMLERGTIVTKLYGKQRRPDRRHLMLIRETRQLLWSTLAAQTRTDYEGTLQLREIREIRVGKNSKEFRLHADDCQRFENSKCFVIMYGNNFKLKSFSVVALSEIEAEHWVRGLRYMVKDTQLAPYTLQLDRWLRREYYALEHVHAHAHMGKPEQSTPVTIKDFKSFLSSVSCKMSTSKFMECFTDDIRRKHDLKFDDFSRLYQKLLLPVNFLPLLGNLELADKQTVRPVEFQRFLASAQQDNQLNDLASIASFMRDFVQDVEREVQQPFLTINEFVDYLFSKQNDLWDAARHDAVNMDMNQPLCCYWIASSHNTYLTGDQFSSESSCEAYARALRMGCRCIELDCWNGPDNLPYIFHGHTMTSKIKFMDVIKTIKEHAFVTSEYPVILSIEQNCSLEQQRNMAQALIEVFGDMLLTQPCDRNELQLPSPNQLRRKIILKHKKLPQFDENVVASNNGSLNTFSQRSSLSGGGDEHENMQKILKKGLLYFKDPVDKCWNLYQFVLTQQELIYSSEINEGRNGNSEDDDFGLSACNLNSSMQQKQKDTAANDELHFGEHWFHGKLEGGRKEADQLLETYNHLGDGTFLVRESATFVGDYSLSFWRRNRPNHCRIKSKHEQGAIKYYLVENFVFDSLYALIVYYRKNMLRSSEFSIILKEPVPQPKKHESQDWFHPNTSKEQAEQALLKLEIGSFLVRPSVQSINAFVISFSINRKIKHCRILQEGRLYAIDTMQFESLVSLIHYYMRNPLYRNVKLMHPVSQELLRQTLLEHAQQLLHGSEHSVGSDSNGASNYMGANLDEYVTCKALYSYKADKPDELSFPKHAIITNVQRNNSMWWKGDYGGLIQQHFPANYVKVIDSSSEDYNSLNEEGQDGRTDSIEIYGAVASLFESNEPGIIIKLQIQTPTMQSPFIIGFDQQEAAYEWIKAIQEAAFLASQLATERRKKERTARVAKEMSDLIIYFRSVPFRDHSWIFQEMSSFPETKAEKQFIQQNMPLFLAYHRQQISRVYPKGQRLDSSNFNPVPFWNVGSQMIALNYQTGDKAMQLNQAKFRQNGNCGYILKPSFMRSDAFNPNNPQCEGLLESKVTVRIIAARHLFRGGKSNNPQIVVELVGSSFDSGIKHRSKVNENGFNPVWNESVEFTVHNTHFALLRFEVQDEDMFAETHFIAQACYPLACVRPGYRSIILRNKFSEELESCSLLIHLDISRRQPAI